MNSNSLKIFLLLFALFSLAHVTCSMDDKDIARLKALLQDDAVKAASDKKSPEAKAGRGSSSESEGEKGREKHFGEIDPASSTDISAANSPDTTLRTRTAEQGFVYISPNHSAPSTSPSLLEGFDMDQSPRSKSASTSSDGLSTSPDTDLMFNLDSSEQSDPTDPSTSEKGSSESDSDSDRKKNKSPSPITESDSDEEQVRIPTPDRNSPDHFSQGSKSKGDAESEDEIDTENNDELNGSDLLSDNLISPELLGFLAGAGVIVGGYSAYAMNDRIKEEIDTGLTYLQERAEQRLFKPVLECWKKLQSEQPTRGDLARFALIAGYLYIFQKANRAFSLVKSVKRIAGNCFNKAVSVTNLIGGLINRHKAYSFIIGTGAVGGALWALSKYRAERMPAPKRSYTRFMELLTDDELQYLASAMNDKKKSD